MASKANIVPIRAAQAAPSTKQAAPSPKRKLPAGVPQDTIAPIIKGANGVARMRAYDQIATLSYIEAGTRAQCVDNLRVALGTKPRAEHLAAAKAEYVIGRVASRMRATDQGADAGALLNQARVIVLQCAMPSKSAKPSKLKAGLLRRRTEAEQKLVRAGDEAWSQVLAEVGLGTAQTQAERGKKKRAPQMAGSKGAGQEDAGQDSDEGAGDITPPTTRDSAAAHVLTQSATLLAYANKYAALLPGDFGAAIMAFRRAALDAGNALALLKAKEDAEA